MQKLNALKKRVEKLNVSVSRLEEFENKIMKEAKTGWNQDKSITMSEYLTKARNMGLSNEEAKIIKEDNPYIDAYING